MNRLRSDATIADRSGVNLIQDSNESSAGMFGPVANIAEKSWKEVERMKKVYLALAVLTMIALVVVPASAERWAGYEVDIVPGEDGMASGTFTIFGEGEYGVVDLVGAWSVDRATRPPTVTISVAGIVERPDGEVILIEHEFTFNGDGNTVPGRVRQIVEWAQSILES